MQRSRSMSDYHMGRSLKKDLFSTREWVISSVDADNVFGPSYDGLTLHVALNQCVDHLDELEDRYTKIKLMEQDKRQREFQRKILRRKLKYFPQNHDLKVKTFVEYSRSYINQQIQQARWLKSKFPDLKSMELKREKNRSFKEHSGSALASKFLKGFVSPLSQSKKKRKKSKDIFSSENESSLKQILEESDSKEGVSGARNTEDSHFNLEGGTFLTEKVGVDEDQQDERITTFADEESEKKVTEKLRSTLSNEEGSSSGGSELYTHESEDDDDDSELDESLQFNPQLIKMFTVILKLQAYFRGKKARKTYRILWNARRRGVRVMLDHWKIFLWTALYHRFRLKVNAFRALRAFSKLKDASSSGIFYVSPQSFLNRSIVCLKEGQVTPVNPALMLKSLVSDIPEALFVADFDSAAINVKKKLSEFKQIAREATQQIKANADSMRNNVAIDVTSSRKTILALQDNNSDASNNSHEFNSLNGILLKQSHSSSIILNSSNNNNNNFNSKSANPQAYLESQDHERKRQQISRLHSLMTRSNQQQKNLSFLPNSPSHPIKPHQNIPPAPPNHLEGVVLAAGLSSLSTGAAKFDEEENAVIHMARHYARLRQHSEKYHFTLLRRAWLGWKEHHLHLRRRWRLGHKRILQLQRQFSSKYPSWSTNELRSLTFEFLLRLPRTLKAFEAKSPLPEWSSRPACPVWDVFAKRFHTRSLAIKFQQRSALKQWNFWKESRIAFRKASQVAKDRARIASIVRTFNGFAQGCMTHAVEVKTMRQVLLAWSQQTKRSRATGIVASVISHNRCKEIIHNHWRAWKFLRMKHLLSSLRASKSGVTLLYPILRWLNVSSAINVNTPMVETETIVFTNEGMKIITPEISALTSKSAFNVKNNDSSILPDDNSLTQFNKVFPTSQSTQMLGTLSPASVLSPRFPHTPDNIQDDNTQLNSQTFATSPVAHQISLSQRISCPLQLAPYFNAALLARAWQLWSNRAKRRVRWRLFWLSHVQSWKSNLLRKCLNVWKDEFARTKQERQIAERLALETKQKSKNAQKNQLDDLISGKSFQQQKFSKPLPKLVKPDPSSSEINYTPSPTPAPINFTDTNINNNNNNNTSTLLPSPRLKKTYSKRRRLYEILSLSLPIVLADKVEWSPSPLLLPIASRVWALSERLRGEDTSRLIAYTQELSRLQVNKASEGGASSNERGGEQSKSGGMMMNTLNSTNLLSSYNGTGTMHITAPLLSTSNHLTASNIPQLKYVKNSEDGNENHSSVTISIQGGGGGSIMFGSASAVSARNSSRKLLSFTNAAASVISNNKSIRSKHHLDQELTATNKNKSGTENGFFLGTTTLSTAQIKSRLAKHFNESLRKNEGVSKASKSKPSKSVVDDSSSNQNTPGGILSARSVNSSYGNELPIKININDLSNNITSEGISVGANNKSNRTVELNRSTSFTHEEPSVIKSNNDTNNMTSLTRIILKAAMDESDEGSDIEPASDNDRDADMLSVFSHSMVDRFSSVNVRFNRSTTNNNLSDYGGNSLNGGGGGFGSVISGTSRLPSALSSVYMQRLVMGTLNPAEALFAHISRLDIKAVSNVILKCGPSVLRLRDPTFKETPLHFALKLCLPAFPRDVRLRNPSSIKAPNAHPPWDDVPNIHPAPPSGAVVSSLKFSRKGPKRALLPALRDWLTNGANVFRRWGVRPTQGRLLRMIALLVSCGADTEEPIDALGFTPLEILRKFLLVFSYGNVETDGGHWAQSLHIYQRWTPPSTPELAAEFGFDGNAAVQDGANVNSPPKKSARAFLAALSRNPQALLEKNDDGSVLSRSSAGAFDENPDALEEAFLANELINKGRFGGAESLDEEKDFFEQNDPQVVDEEGNIRSNSHRRVSIGEEDAEIVRRDLLKKLKNSNTAFGVGEVPNNNELNSSPRGAPAAATSAKVHMDYEARALADLGIELSDLSDLDEEDEKDATTGNGNKGDDGGWAKKILSTHETKGERDRRVTLELSLRAKRSKLFFETLARLVFDGSENAATDIKFSSQPTTTKHSTPQNLLTPRDKSQTPSFHPPGSTIANLVSNTLLTDSELQIVRSYRKDARRVFSLKFCDPAASHLGVLTLYDETREELENVKDETIWHQLYILAATRYMSNRHPAKILSDEIFDSEALTQPKIQEKKAKEARLLHLCRFAHLHALLSRVEGKYDPPRLRNSVQTYWMNRLNRSSESFTPDELLGDQPTRHLFKTMRAFVMAQPSISTKRPFGFNGFAPPATPSFSFETAPGCKSPPGAQIRHFKLQRTAQYSKMATAHSSQVNGVDVLRLALQLGVVWLRADFEDWSKKDLLKLFSRSIPSLDNQHTKPSSLLMSKSNDNSQSKKSPRKNIETGLFIETSDAPSQNSPFISPRSNITPRRASIMSYSSPRHHQASTKRNRPMSPSTLEKTTLAAELSKVQTERFAKEVAKLELGGAEALLIAEHTADDAPNNDLDDILHLDQENIDAAANESIKQNADVKKQFLSPNDLESLNDTNEAANAENLAQIMKKKQHSNVRSALGSLMQKKWRNVRRYMKENHLRLDIYQKEGSNRRECERREVLLHAMLGKDASEPRWLVIEDLKPTKREMKLIVDVLRWEDSNDPAIDFAALNADDDELDKVFLDEMKRLEMEMIVGYSIPPSREEVDNAHDILLKIKETGSTPDLDLLKQKLESVRSRRLETEIKLKEPKESILKRSSDRKQLEIRLITQLNSAKKLRDSLWVSPNTQEVSNNSSQSLNHIPSGLHNENLIDDQNKSTSLSNLNNFQFGVEEDAPAVGDYDENFIDGIHSHHTESKSYNKRSSAYNNSNSEDDSSYSSSTNYNTQGNKDRTSNGRRTSQGSIVADERRSRKNSRIVSHISGNETADLIGSQPNVLNATGNSMKSTATEKKSEDKIKKRRKSNSNHDDDLYRYKTNIRGIKTKDELNEAANQSELNNQTSRIDKPAIDKSNTHLSKKNHKLKKNEDNYNNLGSNNQVSSQINHLSRTELSASGKHQASNFSKSSNRRNSTLKPSSFDDKMVDDAGFDPLAETDQARARTLPFQTSLSELQKSQMNNSTRRIDTSDDEKVVHEDNENNLLDSDLDSSFETSLFNPLEASMSAGKRTSALSNDDVQSSDSPIYDKDENEVSSDVKNIIDSVDSNDDSSEIIGYEPPALNESDFKAFEAAIGSVVTFGEDVRMNRDPAEVRKALKDAQDRAIAERVLSMSKSSIRKGVESSLDSSSNKSNAGKNKKSSLFFYNALESGDNTEEAIANLSLVPSFDILDALSSVPAFANAQMVLKNQTPVTSKKGKYAKLTTPKYESNNPNNSHIPSGIGMNIHSVDGLIPHSSSDSSQQIPHVPLDLALDRMFKRLAEDPKVETSLSQIGVSAALLANLNIQEEAERAGLDWVALSSAFYKLKSSKDYKMPQIQSEFQPVDSNDVISDQNQEPLELLNEDNKQNDIKNADIDEFEGDLSEWLAFVVICSLDSSAKEFSHKSELLKCIMGEVRGLSDFVDNMVKNQIRGNTPPDKYFLESVSPLGIQSRIDPFPLSEQNVTTMRNSNDTAATTNSINFLKRYLMSFSNISPRVLFDPSAPIHPLDIQGNLIIPSPPKKKNLSSSISSSATSLSPKSTSLSPAPSSARRRHQLHQIPSRGRSVTLPLMISPLSASENPLTVSPLQRIRARTTTTPPSSSHLVSRPHSPPAPELRPETLSLAVNSLLNPRVAFPSNFTQSIALPTDSRVSSSKSAHHGSSQSSSLLCSNVFPSASLRLQRAHQLKDLGLGKFRPGSSPTSKQLPMAVRGRSIPIHALSSIANDSRASKDRPDWRQQEFVRTAVQSREEKLRHDSSPFERSASYQIDRDKTRSQTFFKRVEIITVVKDQPKVHSPLPQGDHHIRSPALTPGLHVVSLPGFLPSGASSNSPSQGKASVVSQLSPARARSRPVPSLISSSRVSPRASPRARAIPSLPSSPSHPAATEIDYPPIALPSYSTSSLEFFKPSVLPTKETASRFKQDPYPVPTTTKGQRALYMLLSRLQPPTVQPSTLIVPLRHPVSPVIDPTCPAWCIRSLSSLIPLLVGSDSTFATDDIISYRPHRSLMSNRKLLEANLQYLPLVASVSNISPVDDTYVMQFASRLPPRPRSAPPSLIPSTPLFHEPVNSLRSLRYALEYLPSQNSRSKTSAHRTRNVALPAWLNRSVWWPLSKFRVPPELVARLKRRRWNISQGITNDGDVDKNGDNFNLFYSSRLRRRTYEANANYSDSDDDDEDEESEDSITTERQLEIKALKDLLNSQYYENQILNGVVDGVEVPDAPRRVVFEGKTGDYDNESRNELFLQNSQNYKDLSASAVHEHDIQIPVSANRQNIIDSRRSSIRRSSLMKRDPSNHEFKSRQMNNNEIPGDNLPSLMGDLPSQYRRQSVSFIQESLDNTQSSDIIQKQQETDNDDNSIGEGSHRNKKSAFKSKQFPFQSMGGRHAIPHPLTDLDLDENSEDFDKNYFHLLHENNDDDDDDDESNSEIRQNSEEANLDVSITKRRNSILSDQLHKHSDKNKTASKSGAHSDRIQSSANGSIHGDMTDKITYDYLIDGETSGQSMHNKNSSRSRNKNSFDAEDKKRKQDLSPRSDIGHDFASKGNDVDESDQVDSYNTGNDSLSDANSRHRFNKSAHSSVRLSSRHRKEDDGDDDFSEHSALESVRSAKSKSQSRRNSTLESKDTRIRDSSKAIKDPAGTLSISMEKDSESLNDSGNAAELLLEDSYSSPRNKSTRQKEHVIRILPESHTSELDAAAPDHIHLVDSSRLRDPLNIPRHPFPTTADQDAPSTTNRLSLAARSHSTATQESSRIPSHTSHPTKKSGMDDPNRITHSDSEREFDNFGHWWQPNDGIQEDEISNFLEEAGNSPIQVAIPPISSWIKKPNVQREARAMHFEDLASALQKLGTEAKIDAEIESKLLEEDQELATMKKDEIKLLAVIESTLQRAIEEAQAEEHRQLELHEHAMKEFHEDKADLDDEITKFKYTIMKERQDRAILRSKLHELVEARAQRKAERTRLLMLAKGHALELSDAFLMDEIESLSVNPLSRWAVQTDQNFTRSKSLSRGVELDEVPIPQEFDDEEVDEISNPQDTRTTFSSTFNKQRKFLSRPDIAPQRSLPATPSMALRPSDSLPLINNSLSALTPEIIQAEWEAFRAKQETRAQKQKDLAQSRRLQQSATVAHLTNEDLEWFENIDDSLWRRRDGINRLDMQKTSSNSGASSPSTPSRFNKPLTPMSFTSSKRILLPPLHDNESKGLFSILKAQESAPIRGKRTTRAHPPWFSSTSPPVPVHRVKGVDYANLQPLGENDDPAWKATRRRVHGGSSPARVKDEVVSPELSSKPESGGIDNDFNLENSLLAGYNLNKVTPKLANNSIFALWSKRREILAPAEKMMVEKEELEATAEEDEQKNDINSAKPTININ